MRLRRAASHCMSARYHCGASRGAAVLAAPRALARGFGTSASGSASAAQMKSSIFARSRSGSALKNSNLARRQTIALGSGFKAEGSGFRAHDSWSTRGIRTWGTGRQSHQAPVSGLRARGLGLIAHGLGLRVQTMEFGIRTGGISSCVTQLIRRCCAQRSRM